jgi:hypothetical protein
MGINRFFSDKKKEGIKDFESTQDIRMAVKKLPYGAEKERMAKHQKYRKIKVGQVEGKLKDVFANGIKEGALLKPTVLAKSRKRENAMLFRNKLLSANYEADPISEQAEDGFYFVRGRSIARVIDKENMQEWVMNICNAAYKEGCVFLDWEIDN